jgi:hypothetical protein
MSGLLVADAWGVYGISTELIEPRRGLSVMVERRMELDRRYHRKEKMRKLKRRLAEARGEARDKILAKIHALSPFWTEPKK